jgi:hypothetical protein
MIYGILVYISCVQRMNICDSSQSLPSFSPIVSLAIWVAIAPVFWAGRYLVTPLLHLTRGELLNSQRFMTKERISRLDRLVMLGFFITSGSFLSGILGLFFPIIALEILLLFLFSLYGFLSCLNTASDWKTTDISSQNQFVQRMYGQIDIEWKAYLIDQKSTWTDLTPRQVQTKEILFILDYYRGVFTHWVQSAINSFLPKIK